MPSGCGRTSSSSRDSSCMTSSRSTTALRIGDTSFAVEENSLNSCRQQLAARIFAVDAGAVYFRLRAARMSGEQQYAVADPNRLGDRVSHEQDRELRVVPQLHDI